MLLQITFLLILLSVSVIYYTNGQYCYWENMQSIPSSALLQINFKPVYSYK